MTDTESPVDRVRETYSEYRDGERRMAMISDPESDQAWVLSTLTMAIDP